MKLRHVILPAIVGAMLLVAATAASIAQGTSVSLGVQDHDSSTPVEITSRELELDQENGTAIFTGDVIVRQGAITMTTQRMVVEYSENPETGKSEIKMIRMFGGVTFVSEEEAAESERAVYNLSSSILEMFENVLVTQGPTALSADKLTYNLETGDGRMDGNVKTVLQQGGN